MRLAHRRQVSGSLRFLTSLLLLCLSGCASSGLGDIRGGGSRSPSTSDDLSEIRGTVEFADPESTFVDLTKVSDVSILHDRGGTTLRLWTTHETLVMYQGNTYRPSDLEEGDKIVTRVEQRDGRWYATEDIRVSYSSSPDPTADGGGEDSGDEDSRGDDPWDDDPRDDDPQTDGHDDDPWGDDPRDDEHGDGTWGSDPWGDDEELDGEDGAEGRFGGTVQALDTRERTIELELDRTDELSRRHSRIDSSFVTDERNHDERDHRVVTLYYDARTRVVYEGNYYEPENLEPGDEILVKAVHESNRWIAEDIEVIGNIRDTRED